MFVAHDKVLSIYREKGRGYPCYSSSSGNITCVLVTESGGQVVLSAGSKIHTLKPDGSTLVSTVNTVFTISGLSMSFDAKALVAYNGKGATVYNLKLGSDNVIRLPSTTNPITSCAFHPQTCQRLYICAGMQLMIYETGKSWSPARIITLPGLDTAVGLSCSPFSKTLITVATYGGNLFLIDTDKENR